MSDPHGSSLFLFLKGAIGTYSGAENQCVAQQFTGMSDKNGQEIYEGDIVKYQTQSVYFSPVTEAVAPVVWSPFGRGFVLDSSMRHKMGDIKYGDYVPILNSWSPEDKVSYKIVGNIFENPELLK